MPGPQEARGVGCCWLLFDSSHSRRRNKKDRFRSLPLLNSVRGLKGRGRVEKEGRKQKVAKEQLQLTNKSVTYLENNT